MVLDTSVLIAILSAEADARMYVEAIAAAPKRLLSAATLLETAIVIESRYGLNGGQKLDEFIHTAQIEVESVTVEQAISARLAYRTYGKGRHPAALNYGDCFSYALAKVGNQPLLFKGDDFTKIDIEPVPLPGA